ncbi:hypothetical protein M378DRAFT_747558 [Amanita muscaria Koide BX008]|uniref:Uncharacterized protein n=1 Tax=Amanita muscaria (strain Koide BX008) TaxID=946122 RepID=A0A0C2WMB0_AMAMK|nr:hypothetical protein M378DRAFT_747558 [Amanita muscaria Koide BX008]
MGHKHHSSTICSNTYFRSFFFLLSCGLGFCILILGLLLCTLRILRGCKRKPAIWVTHLHGDCYNNITIFRLLQVANCCVQPH